MFLPNILKINLSLLTVFLLPPINIDKSPDWAFKFPPDIVASTNWFIFLLNFCFKKLKQVKELVEQSIQILLLPNWLIILPLPIDNALICFGPGTQVIITSENLINASNELVAFPFLDFYCFKDLGLTS